EVLLGQLLDLWVVLVLSQHPDLLWAKGKPIAAPLTAKIARCPLPTPLGRRPRCGWLRPGHRRRCPDRLSWRRTGRRRTTTAGRCSWEAVPSACSGFRTGPERSSP